MNWIKNFFFKLRQTKKYAASNPDNFEEKWSFNASGIQIVSMVTLIFITLGILFAFFIVKGPFSNYFSKNDVTIERKKLENQDKAIATLLIKIDQQDKYIKTISTILKGETVEDSLNENMPDVQKINGNDINTDRTNNETKLSEKVRDDLRTNTKKKKSALQFFVEPVIGVISQHFNLKDHPGVDIVTPKDKNILACLSGTVIYSGYTQKDGFVLVLDHANGFLSVYKHAKTVLKKIGSKVQMSDPIAIVGNTGENSSGPHLHFELWYNQSVVNPEDYMQFEK